MTAAVLHGTCCKQESTHIEILSSCVCTKVYEVAMPHHMVFKELLHLQDGCVAAEVSKRSQWSWTIISDPCHAVPPSAHACSVPPSCCCDYHPSQGLHRQDGPHHQQQVIWPRIILACPYCHTRPSLPSCPFPLSSFPLAHLSSQQRVPPPHCSLYHSRNSPSSFLLALNAAPPSPSPHSPFSPFPWLTYHPSKGLHHQAGPHNQQQVSSREVSQPPPMEASRQCFPEEHNVRLHIAAATAAALQHLVVEHGLLQGIGAGRTTTASTMSTCRTNSSSRLVL